MAWIHPPAIGCRFSFLHIPCGRCGHSTVLYKSCLLIFGGFDGKRWLNDLHCFDSTSLVWSQPRVLGSAPYPRQYHTAVCLGDFLYIFGGYNGFGWLKDLVVLDLISYKWLYPRTFGDIPTGREGHSMIAYNNYLYIHGGWDGCTIGDLYRLDVLSFVWEKIEIAGERPILCGHSCTLLDNKVYMFGGFDGLNWGNSLFRLDLDTHRCEKLEAKGEPVQRGYHSAAVANRYILIYAGYNGKYILGDLVALDTENLIWSLPDTCLGHFPSARNAHTTTLMGSELFMFGGYNGCRDTNDLHILETAAFSTLQDDLKLGSELKFGLTVALTCSTRAIKVHTAVLAARCPKLLDPCEQKEVNVTEKALRLFVEYIYCDLSAEKIPNDCVQDLSSLAYFFGIDRLRMLCDNYPDVPDSTLTSDIMDILKFKAHSDFVVVVEAKEYCLHKVILGCRCPYFRALFESGMSENARNKIELDQFKIAAFEYIIEWIYSDKFSPLFGEKNVDVEVYIEVLVESNLLGLESLMRMAELATVDAINLENVVKLYEVAHALSAVRLKSYTINFILREFDRISLKKELISINEHAFEELNNYLPKRMKRQNSKTSVYPSLSLIRLDKRLMVKPHDPKSSRLPTRELNGIFSMRSPLISNKGISIMRANSPQPQKSLIRKKSRASTFHFKNPKQSEPLDLLVQGVSPRSKNSVDKSPVLRHAGLKISSSLGALQHTLVEISHGSRFNKYKYE